jgi:hypothetical protein
MSLTFDFLERSQPIRLSLHQSRPLQVMSLQLAFLAAAFK